MKTSLLLSLGAVLLLTGPLANAQVAQTGEGVPSDTIPLSTLIATVAKKTGRKFVLDPRVRAGVALVGEEPSKVSRNPT